MTRSILLATPRIFAQFPALKQHVLTRWLILFAILFVALAFANWRNDFALPAQMEQDRLFLQQYRDYLAELKQEPSPQHAAEQWVALAGAWCHSTRPVSFSDLILALPPPTAWPFLSDALKNSQGTFNSHESRCLNLIFTLLNEDPSQGRKFDELTQSVIDAWHQQQINRMFEIGDCIQNKGDGTPVNAAMVQLASLSNQFGKPFSPAGNLYLPDLLRYTSSEQSDLLTGRILREGAQNETFTFGGEHLALLRQKLRDDFPTLAVFPERIYLQNPSDPELVDTYDLYLKTHRNIFAQDVSHRNVLAQDFYSLMFFNCLATKPKQKWADYFYNDDLVFSTMPQLIRLSLQTGLTDSAYIFTKNHQSGASPQVLAQLALITGHLPEVIPLLSNSQVNCNALAEIYWQTGRYDEAVALTRKNINYVLDTPENILGTDIITAHGLVSEEIGHLLKNGALLHRSDWVSEGVSQATHEVNALYDPSCPGYVRPIIVLRLATYLCRIGHGREAEDLIDNLSRHFPLETKANYLISAARVLAWADEAQWDRIVALRKDSPDVWKLIVDLPLIPSLNPGDATTPGVIRLEALAKTGQRTEAASELIDLLAKEKQSPSIRLINWCLDLMGPEYTSHIFNSKTLSPGVADGITARLKFVATQPHGDIIDFHHFEKNFLATGTIIVEPTQGSVEEFELFWSHHLPAEALARLGKNDSPLINLSLSYYYEQMGQPDQADSTRIRGLQGLAGLQDDISWNQFKRWNETVPDLTAHFRKAVKESTIDNPGINILKGRVAMAEGDYEAAAKYLNLAISARPKNVVALRYLLELTGYTPLSREAVREALYQLETEGPLPVRPVVGFGYADLWRAAQQRPVELSIETKSKPKAMDGSATDTTTLDASSSLLLDPDGLTRNFQDIATSRCMINLADLMDIGSAERN